jgi:hypothetical protein
MRISNRLVGSSRLLWFGVLFEVLFEVRSDGLDCGFDAADLARALEMRMLLRGVWRVDATSLILAAH